MQQEPRRTPIFLNEWISMDLSPYVDEDHEDLPELYVPLTISRCFSFIGPFISPLDKYWSNPSGNIGAIRGFPADY